MERGYLIYTLQIGEVVQMGEESGVQEVCGLRLTFQLRTFEK